MAAELERFGDTPEWGSQLVRLVELAGWTVTERTLLDDGVLLIASGYGTSVSAAGDVYAEAAGALFERVMALKKWQRRHAA